MALSLGSLTVTGVSHAAASDATAEAELVAAINAERRRAGLHELVVRTDLQAVARRHSAWMADRGELSHNPGLSSEVCCWRKVGENVGYGPSPGDVHRGFMSSAGHRANVLSPDFTEVGVGVERRDGSYWVTEVFRLPDSAPARPNAEPEPPPPSPSTEPGRAGGPPAPQATEAPSPPPASVDHLTVMLTRVDALERDPPAAQPTSVRALGGVR